MFNIKVKLSLYMPIGVHNVEAPRNSRQSAHEGVKVISPMHHPPLPPGKIPGTQGYSAAGRIMSMKNSSYPTGNRTHDFPTCSVVPQPTAPL
jgi:hypothetical protein